MLPSHGRSRWFKSNSAHHFFLLSLSFRNSTLTCLRIIRYHLAKTVSGCGLSKRQTTVMLGGGSPTRLRENAGNDSSHHVKMLARGYACLRVGTTAFGASGLRRNGGTIPQSGRSCKGLRRGSDGRELHTGCGYGLCPRSREQHCRSLRGCVVGKTRALIQSQLEGLNSAVREIVRGELSRALESKTARPKPQPRTETHRIPSYIPPQVPKGY